MAIKIPKTIHIPNQKPSPEYESMHKNIMIQAIAISIMTAGMQSVKGRIATNKKGHVSCTPNNQHPKGDDQK